MLSGFGWASGTVAMKHFQRARSFDMLNFIAWQMLLGVLPLTLLPLVCRCRNTKWSATYVGLLLWTGALASGFGFVLWIGVLRFLSAGTASLNMLAIPVIALLSSMAVFDERLVGERMDRHRLHRRRPLRSSRFAPGYATRRGERAPPGAHPAGGRLGRMSTPAPPDIAKLQHRSRRRAGPRGRAADNGCGSARIAAVGLAGGAWYALAAASRST